MAFTLWLATRALMRCSSWEPPRQTSSHPPSQTTHNFHPYGWMIRILTFHSNFLSALAGSYIYLGGEVSLCIWGTSPTNFLHFPNNLLRFPNKIASFHQQLESLPQKLVSLPQHIFSFPQQASVTLPPQKNLENKWKFYLVFIPPHPCITLTKAKPSLRI